MRLTPRLEVLVLAVVANLSRRFVAAAVGRLLVGRACNRHAREQGPRRRLKGFMRHEFGGRRVQVRGRVCKERRQRQGRWFWAGHLLLVGGPGARSTERAFCWRANQTDENARTSGSRLLSRRGTRIILELDLRAPIKSMMRPFHVFRCLKGLVSNYENAVRERRGT